MLRKTVCIRKDVTHAVNLCNRSIDYYVYYLTFKTNYKLVWIFCKSQSLVPWKNRSLPISFIFLKSQVSINVSVYVSLWKVKKNFVWCLHNSHFHKSMFTFSSLVALFIVKTPKVFQRIISSAIVLSKIHGMPW